jgi:lipid II isoglutaminyl synthase (glutamine-hydrolysing)
VADLVLVHLYPRLLRTYGDRGNVLALARRAEWRGFRVHIEEVSIGERIPSDAGLILLGGGTDRVQEIIGADLAERRGELREAAARGAVILGVCGGYQFLGTRYVMPEGRAIDGLGLLDVETRASERRIIGRIRGRAELWGRSFELVGFENHGGRTALGRDVRPLASVPRRQGNNGRDGTEGAVDGSVVGTYLHGPVLAANPDLADTLLARALEPVTGLQPLAPLDDTAERRAHVEAARRIRDERPMKRRSVLVAAIVMLLILLLAGSVAAREIDDDDRPDQPPAAASLHSAPGPPAPAVARASLDRALLVGRSVRGRPIHAEELAPGRLDARGVERFSDAVLQLLT